MCEVTTSQTFGSLHTGKIDSIPPHAYFIGSAIFRYLGPAFAVLLFAHVGVLGVAWLRIASAAAVFALWKRPWRFFRELSWNDRGSVVGLGLVLAGMNVCFYFAVSRLPLGTVGSIEFLGPIALAAYGSRTLRNIVALLLASAGVFVLTKLQLGGSSVGYLFAFANCALFVLYIVLGHGLAKKGASAGVGRLAIAMLVSLIAVTPFSISEAAGTFLNPRLLLAGGGVGICSSVIPYVCDQFAMARLSKATFSVLLSLLPATACLIGIIVLRQVPSVRELAGISCVIAGVALRRTDDDLEPNKRSVSAAQTRKAMGSCG